MPDSIKPPDDMLPAWVKAALIASQLADASSTTYALNNNPNAREANNLFSPFADKPYLSYPIKAGVGYLSGKILDNLHKNHPKFATGLGIGASIAPSLIALRNFNIGNK